MDISQLGGGSVKLSGKNINVVTDPIASNAKADVVLQTAHSDVSGEGMVIDGPGEYEIKGTMITGVPARLHIDETGEKGTMYSLRIDGISVAVLGNIAPGLSDKQAEALGQIDVLVVPVGGHGLTLDAEAAAKIVSQLEPKYVIPVHYEDGTKYPMPQEKVDNFLKEMGANPEPITKLKLASKEMPMETTVVLLSPNAA